MKHSTECINLWSDELVALASAIGVAIPQSLQDLITRWPQDPTGVPNAATRMRNKITLAVRQRSQLQTDYAWPYYKTPPTWTKPPMQISGGTAISVSSQQPGVVIPAAPSGGTPNPPPPISGPPLPQRSLPQQEAQHERE